MEQIFFKGLSGAASLPEQEKNLRKAKKFFRTADLTQWNGCADVPARKKFFAALDASPARGTHAQPDKRRNSVVRVTAPTFPHGLDLSRRAAPDKLRQLLNPTCPQGRPTFFFFFGSFFFLESQKEKGTFKVFSLSLATFFPFFTKNGKKVFIRLAFCAVVSVRTAAMVRTAQRTCRKPRLLSFGLSKSPAVVPPA